MKLQIQLNGAKVIKGAIQKIIDEWKFEENVSKEYKSGFYDFGNAVIDMLSAWEEDNNA